MSPRERVEELTLRLVDEEISEREAAELDRLLDADPTLERVHVGLLEQEAALRG